MKTQKDIAKEHFASTNTVGRILKTNRHTRTKKERP